MKLPSIKSSAWTNGVPGTLGILIFIFICAAPVRTDQHPVSLDPKADSSTCITCHEDKTKGKSVHSAIATGCLSCHEIRVNHDITG